jgi:integrase
LKIA